MSEKINSKCCAFTICAKNYLAQALTLKNSFVKHNPTCSFYIFLADMPTQDINDVTIVALDVKWCPKWKEMALKYNVIEFATSIKPFCFNKLFEEGYQKVIYLDPDIYVSDSLDYIYDVLDMKSIMLTPHYNNIQTEYTGSVSEEELLFVGIYNLGFAAIRNNVIGRQIIEWWCNRLENKCYADHHDSLHVDQRWMDFIPGFFPNDTEISHHAGINTAIWNLHERQLVVKDKKYFVIDRASEEIFPLLFYHFSGFDPDNTHIINRRHPKYNTDTFPDFQPLIDEYATLVLANDYKKYHSLNYSFNAFNTGENIMPIHRRLFREYIKECASSDNQDNTIDEFYKLLEKKRLLSNIASNDFNANISQKTRDSGRKVEKISKKTALVFIRLFGFRKFYLLLRFAEKFSRLEYHSYLLK